MSEERMHKIKQRLIAALQPDTVEIIDDSDKHVGHAGAAAGGGHFRIRISSKAFIGLSSLKRHQLIYEILAPMMKKDIHALSITATLPEAT